MGRPKKAKPNKRGLFEYKGWVPTLDGGKARKSFYSDVDLDDAKAKHQTYLVEQEVALRTGEIFVSDDCTFKEWAEKWLKLKKPQVDESTFYTTYELPTQKHLIPFFGAAQLANIRKIDIQKFFNEKSYLSQSMLDKLHMILKTMFEDALDNDLCYKNPVRKIQHTSRAQPNIKQVYTDEQIDTVQGLVNVEHYEIIVFLETGIRLGELCGLDWDTGDIDLRGAVLHVRRSIASQKGGGIKVKPPKWNSYRDVPLTSMAIKALSNLPSHTGPVFPNRDGGFMHPRSMESRVERFMKKMNAQFSSVPILTPHELRHTYGTKLRRHGADIYTIQKLMGHKDIKVTSEIYVENELPVLQKVVKMAEKSALKKKA